MDFSISTVERCAVISLSLESVGDGDVIISLDSVISKEDRSVDDFIVISEVNLSMSTLVVVLLSA